MHRFVERDDFTVLLFVIGKGPLGTCRPMIHALLAISTIARYLLSVFILGVAADGLVSD